MAQIKLLANNTNGYHWFECGDCKLDDDCVIGFELHEGGGTNTYVWYEQGFGAIAVKTLTGAGGGSLFGPWGIPVGAVVGFLKAAHDDDKKPAGYYNVISGVRLEGNSTKISASDNGRFRR